jgi:hypothetical protein
MKGEEIVNQLCDCYGCATFVGSTEVDFGQTIIANYQNKSLLAVDGRNLQVLPRNYPPQLARNSGTLIIDTNVACG